LLELTSSITSGVSIRVLVVGIKIRLYIFWRG